MNARAAILFSFGFLAAPVFAQSIGGGACAASNLTGPYSLTLSGRSISAGGSSTGTLQGVGIITFDGKSAVTASGALNTNAALGQKFSFAGSYTVQSNCYVTITFTTGITATFAAVVWSNGTQFNFTGADSTYVYSGRGTSNQPAGCTTSSLSGEYTYLTSGPTLSGTAQIGAGDETGLLQFDGQGNVTAASYTITSSGGNSTALTATGTYSVASNCVATATLTDSTGKTNTMNFVIEAAYGQNSAWMEASSGFIRLGAGHSAFLNPTQSIANVFSYAVNATPPGSVFVLYGFGLAATGKSAGATNVPFPTTLLNTKVTVNGEAVPLYYVDANQIDAVMPWDIPGGASYPVIVTNGTATSNAAAVYVPATGTPGIAVYSNNRAVVVNSDNITVNSSSAGANVGDEVVAYFTGGGPVMAAGKLVSGSPAPAGQSPVTGSTSVTVGGMNATVVYMGLTAGSIGLYQANFLVPQLAKGSYPVVITIAGQASNTLGGPSPNPVMTVSN
ncbi:MAG TPA: hypothetical protein VGG72_34515 [Bryobacteraceae bacterium]|jgi:uncharacterized protein (TIGR03437 family)